MWLGRFDEALHESERGPANWYSAIAHHLPPTNGAILYFSPSI